MFSINWPTEINTSDVFVNVAIDLNNIIELQTSEIADNIKAGAIFINMSKQEKFPLWPCSARQPGSLSNTHFL